MFKDGVKDCVIDLDQSAASVKGGMTGEDTLRVSFTRIVERTGENRRFDRCILDWTNQSKSCLPLVAKSAFLQTATAAHISGPIYETFFCSGSLKPGSFGYIWQTALALIGPI